MNQLQQSAVRYIRQLQFKSICHVVVCGYSEVSGGATGRRNGDIIALPVIKYLVVPHPMMALESQW